MLDRSKHEISMRELLLKLYSDATLSRLLLFKGGTACYFFHGLPRFSTDLDFSLTDEVDKEPIFTQISTIVSKVGTLKDSWIKKNTIFFLVEHTPQRSAIKMEISTRKIEKINTHEFLPFYGTTVRIMKKDCIFANKLFTLTNRHALAARDLYDVNYFFSQGWDIDRKILEKLTGMPLTTFFESLPDFIEKSFNQRNITQGLNHLLITESQRDFVKLRLKKETIQQIQIYLDSVDS